ncbi:MAG: glycosyltransferase family 4 protein [Pseudomonadota bacterium]|nr:glycosyltransferase family 4 protein [Pseudomonadota bacterium]
MTIYVDLTDIFHFMRYAKNVTGIQRTTLLMVESLLLNHDDQQFRFIAYHPVFKQVVEFDGDWLRKVRGRLPSEFVEQFSLHANWRTMQQFVSLLFNKAKVKSSSEPNWRKANPEPGDTICVLGNYWGSPSLFNFLRKQARRGMKIDVLIYDLIPLLFPEFSPKRFNHLYRKRLLELNSFVTRYFAISKATAKDLKAYIEQHSVTPVASISVIPLAQEFPFWVKADEQPPPIRSLVQTIAEKPFVLCVGTIEKRKNQSLLLGAWARLHQELGPELPRLVLLGKYGWYVEELKSLLDRESSVKAFATQISDATDAEVAFLFKHCLFTAYPSLYEGWGLPVGESLWFGKSCLTSSTSSMPEAGGDMCLYVDPANAVELYDGAKALVMSADKRTALEFRISATKLRTWSDVADDLALLLP